MMPSRCLADTDTWLSLCAWVGSVISRCNKWVKPRMAFIGVRISWLIFAKKTLLAWLAATAADRVISSS